MNYLLDTCVLSELVKNQPDASVIEWMSGRAEHELFVSSITIAEMRRGVERLPESRRRTELSEWLHRLEDDFDERVLPFAREAARAWATMMADAKGKGRPIAAFDSLIAATAMAARMTLVTRNTRDFLSSGVDLLDPWALK